jgi:mxaJ protein
MPPHARRTGLLVALVAVGWAMTAQAEDPSGALTVCADPNNLPFTNKAGEGFENKLAEFVAAKLGKPVSYVWWAQRRGFVRSTLAAGDCELVMGVPTGFGPVESTRPYYRASYVFLSRADRDLDVSAITDPRLRSLTVGVHLLGSDGFNTPPAEALGAQGIVANVVGYPIYGDYREPNPPARLIEAVEKGDIDIAAVWGPLAGYFAKRSPVKLRIVPITDTERFRPLAFSFDIAMGVRHGGYALKQQLDWIIAGDGPRMREILFDFGVPLVTKQHVEWQEETP